MNSITSFAVQLQPTLRFDQHARQPEKDAKEVGLQPEQLKAKNAPITKELALSQQELVELRKLESIDNRVRAHEQAHLAAAGGIAKGGASFQTTTGPDGKQYAVGGEVSIDTSPVAGDPQATILKARQIRRAAQAPLEPSAQDRLVAASAYATEQKALVELRQLKLEESQVAEGESEAFIAKAEQGHRISEVA